MESIAARNEVTYEVVFNAANRKTDARCCGGQVVQAYVFSELVHHRATGFGSCVEILRDRGLAISHHAAACVPVGIYEKLRAIVAIRQHQQTSRVDEAGRERGFAAMPSNARVTS